MITRNWLPWYGGESPVPHLPVTVNWGPYRRTYERADMVAWQNLPKDGRYMWRWA